MYEIRSHGETLLQSLYDRFDQEACQTAEKHLSSYDIRKLQIDTRMKRRSFKRMIVGYSLSVIGDKNKANCTEYADNMQKILNVAFDHLHCYWSKLFVAMPLRIVPDQPEARSANGSSFRKLVIEALSQHIDCSNYLLREKSGEADVLEMTERFEGLAVSNQGLVDEANRFLEGYLRKQRAVSIR